MFRQITTFLFPRTDRNVQWVLQMSKAALVLSLTAQCAWAQPGVTSPLPSNKATTTSGTANSNPLTVTVGTTSTTQTPTQPATVAPPVPVTSIETLAQRIDVLAKAIESATSAAKPPKVDPWQDTKSIVLNVISNRIDSWLFGDGKGSVGFVAQIVAVLAFIIALVRLILAFAMLNPATPPTTWGRIKAGIQKNSVVRVINVFIGILAVIFTGAALYVVMSARATPDISQASITALQESLMACQTALSKAPKLQQPPPLPSSTAQLQGLEAIEKLRTTCESAIRAKDNRLLQIEGAIASIDSKQPWTSTKILAFIAWVYLLVAVTVAVTLLWVRRHK